MISLGGAEEIHIVEFCFLTPVLTGSSDEGQQPLAASQQVAPLASFSIITFRKMSRKKDGRFLPPDFCNKYNIFCTKYLVFLF